MKLITLTERITELESQHGGLRAVARVLQIDPSYLLRLKTGEKNNPSKVYLQRMGLRAKTLYERVK